MKTPRLVAIWHRRDEIPLTMEAWWCLQRVEARLSRTTADVPRTLRRGVEIEHRKGPGGETERRETARIVAAVDRAARYHLKAMTCLRRTLAAAELAHRRDLPARLRIGVARKESGIEAHAWIEVGGEAVEVDSLQTQEFFPLSPVSEGVEEYVSC